MSKIDLTTLKDSKVKFSSALSFEEAQKETAYADEDKGKIYFTPGGVVLGGNVIADVTPITGTAAIGSPDNRKVVPTLQVAQNLSNKKIDSIIVNGTETLNSDGTTSISLGDKGKELPIYSTESAGVKKNTVNIPEATIDNYGIVKQMRIAAVKTALDKVANNEEDAVEPSYNYYASARDVYNKLLEKADKAEITSAMHYIGKSDPYNTSNKDTTFKEGLTLSKVTLGGEEVTAVAGDVVIYVETDDNITVNYLEYIFDGTKWSYIGGAVYTAADKTKLDSLMKIESVGNGLNVTVAGKLEVEVPSDDQLGSTGTTNAFYNCKQIETLLSQVAMLWE